jgi:hypothetical protein
LVTTLGESLARCDAAQPDYELRADIAGPGWRRCAELIAEPILLDEWRSAVAAVFRTVYGRTPPQTAAAYVASWYLGVPAMTGALLFRMARRVPALGSAELAFRLGTGLPLVAGMAVLESEFACLPDDPAAGSAGTTVVRDVRALGNVLRERFTAHAAEFVAGYEPRVRIGCRTLWATATDALDAALWRAGQYGGTEAEGVTDAGVVLDARYPPLTAASTIFSTGPESWTRRRESCCFHYALTAAPGRRGTECETCPRIVPRRRP